MHEYRNADDAVDEILKRFECRAGVTAKVKAAMVRAYVDGGLDAMRVHGYHRGGVEYFGSGQWTLDRAQTEWIKGVIR